MTTLIGVNLDLTKAGTTTDGAGAEFSMLERYDHADGSQWVYIQAGEVIAQYDVVAIDRTGQAMKITKALADAGRIVAVAQIAFADNDLGWACVRAGETARKVKVLASCPPDVRLYTSGTAGSLDNTDASQTAVFGIVLRATSGASAGAGNGLTINAIIAFPSTQATA